MKTEDKNQSLIMKKHPPTNITIIFSWVEPFYWLADKLIDVQSWDEPCWEVAHCFVQFSSLCFFLFLGPHLFQYWVWADFLFCKSHDWTLYVSVSFYQSCLLSCKSHFILFRCFLCWLGEQCGKNDVYAVLWFVHPDLFADSSYFRHWECFPSL